MVELPIQSVAGKKFLVFPLNLEVLHPPCVTVIESRGGFPGLFLSHGSPLVLVDPPEGKLLGLCPEPHGLGIVFGQPADPFLKSLLKEGENLIKLVGGKDKVAGGFCLDGLRLEFAGLYPFTKGCTGYEKF